MREQQPDLRPTLKNNAWNFVVSIKVKHKQKHPKQNI
jgi:hypothetical protein